VPWFLVNRVYRSGSLRLRGNGFRFRLHNPTLPVSILGIHSLKLDGAQLDPAQIWLVCCGRSRPVETISPQEPFEVPSLADLAVLVRGWPLPPGRHVLELTFELKGYGEISAEIRDRVPDREIEPEDPHRFRPSDPQR
jgi:hypothetical protein